MLVIGVVGDNLVDNDSTTATLVTVMGRKYLVMMLVGVVVVVVLVSMSERFLLVGCF